MYVHDERDMISFKHKYVYVYICIFGIRNTCYIYIYTRAGTLCFHLPQRDWKNASDLERECHHRHCQHIWTYWEGLLWNKSYNSNNCVLSRFCKCVFLIQPQHRMFFMGWNDFNIYYCSILHQTLCFFKWCWLDSTPNFERPWERNFEWWLKRNADSKPIFERLWEKTLSDSR